MEDLTGRRFGRWTVLGPAERQEGKAVRWHCRCDCGTERDVFATALRQGRSGSCGCGATFSLIDLTGKRFGRLTVLERAEGPGPARWRCRCDCGREVTVPGRYLKQNKTRSCGCLVREIARERAQNRLQKMEDRIIPILQKVPCDLCPDPKQCEACPWSWAELSEKSVRALAGRILTEIRPESERRQEDAVHTDCPVPAGDAVHSGNCMPGTVEERPGDPAPAQHPHRPAAAGE